MSRFGSSGEGLLAGGAATFIQRTSSILEKTNAAVPKGGSRIRFFL